MANSLLEDLNPEQRRAVEHPGGPLLILAGAGTGKTRTITRRVAWLVHEQRIPASRILAITFTNKAARSMRHRVAEWLPEAGLWVGTFHATCARMLRQDPEAVARTRDFTILDEDDRRKLLRRLIKDSGWDPATVRPRVVGQILSDWKRRRIRPEHAAEEAALSGLLHEQAARIFRDYELALGTQNSLDFDDLLSKGLDLIEHDRQGPRRWVDRFQHVLVDEYQDTNEVQYRLVRALSEGSRNIAVCGDPDQSIYRWRGADIGNILRFEEDFAGTEVVRLERNYRSVGNVLRAAQHVIQFNRQRKEKDLWTEREAGLPLRCVESADEELEALEVADQVSRWIGEGTPPSEIAVFYRTNASSRPLEAAFTRRQLPYQVVGGLSFFERREIKDLLAYGRMVVNPRDDVAVERIVNVPPRAIGAKTVERLHQLASDHSESLLGAMRLEEVREQFASRARNSLLKFLSTYVQISERLDSAERALRTILDRTGYRLYAESLGDTEDVDRSENIDELLAFAAEYDDREGGGLRGFLEEVTLLTDQDRWDEQAQRVSLMTVHTAKGLEFDRVVVIGLEEGLFPHARSIEDPDGLEEERRLFYVALTRAREELLLSCSRLRFRTGQPGPSAPSRFLDEIPADVREEVEREEIWEEPSSQEAPYQPNDLVRHRTFGRGTVLRVLGRGVNQRVVVRFRDHTERQLLLAYAPLEKVE